MNHLQQPTIEIALQIPGCAGYQAKERRREADKLVRMLNTWPPTTLRSGQAKSVFEK